MVKNPLILLILVTLILMAYAQYKKVIHNYDPEAKCLDGSPGILYVHEGGDPKKILIFFIGGGMCGEQTLDQTIESCYQRSKTLLGSSKFWPDEIPSELVPSYYVSGYLSTDPSKNAFAGWTKFYLGYCDGSKYQGYSKDPIKYKDTLLYFRGGAITRSHINWIHSKYDLKGADKIILTGMSGGGTATNIWSNYVKNFVGDANKVYTIADSAFYMNVKNFTSSMRYQVQMENIYKVANIDEGTPIVQCNQAHKDEKWKCLFIQYGYPYIKGKFMVISSQYDSNAIEQILNVGCLQDGTSGRTISSCNTTQMAFIEQYRSLYLETLLKFANSNLQLSFWSIACSNHVYACNDQFYNSQLQKIPMMVGLTMRDAVEKFVLEDQKIAIFDAGRWPSNSKCAL